MPDLAPYDPTVTAAAQEWNLDPNLLRAVIGQESGGNPGAVSGKGARGLTGLMPDTAKGLGVTDPSDPVQQIFAGAKYLSEALDKEKTPEAALLYYHGGPNWRAFFGPESQAYVPAVTARYQAIGKGSQTAAVPAAAAPDAVMSDDAFLKATGATAAAGKPAGGDDEAAFLAATGAAVPQAAAASATPGVANPAALVPTTDEGGASPGAAAAAQAAPAAPAQPPGGQLSAADILARDKAVLAGVGRVAQAAVQGMQEGYGDEPLGLGPGAVGFLRRAGVYPAAPGGGNPLQRGAEGVIGTVAAMGDAGLRDINALYRGGQAAVAQTGAELGQPQLGRDLAVMPDAFLGMPHELPTIAQARKAAAPIVNRLLPGNAAPAPAGNPLAPKPAAAPVSAPDAVPEAVAAGPQPGMGAPAPSSAGAAATPGALAGMTPQQEAAYRGTAEGQKLLEPQQPGIPDRNLYVPGVQPNAAEIKQSVNTARELKALNITVPEVSQEAREIAARNNEARQQFFQQAAGSPVDIANAEAARAAQAEQDLATAWRNKQPVDATPVLQTIDAALGGPEGKIDPVRLVLSKARDALFDGKGALETDPLQLYGARRQVQFLLSKKALGENPSYGDPDAVRALMSVRDALDTTIEGGAQGYQQFLQNYATASRPIDTMQVLQDFEPKIHDTQNRITYAQVQRMMKQIVDARQAPGVSPFKSIPDDTMQQLWALRDDLRRSASAQELARAPGSDTAQNAWDIAKQYAGAGASLAVHGAANYVAPGVGSLAVNAVKGVTGPLRAVRTAQKARTRGLNMLHPDTSQMRNALLPDE